ncbi:MAG: ABC transporter substrate-binding protein [Clostridiales bacterium]|jgi:NitT/TauT family transport system substrate-binding protein|nr:ABC transporter substrate-binding protein [Clostridiales bacterium]
MKKLFKRILIVLVCLSAVTAMASCQWIIKKPPQDKKIVVYMPDGAPLLSLTKMRADAQNVADGYKVDYQTVADPTALTAALMKGEADFAVAPINVCAALYNNGSGYLFGGVNIWGIIHIVSNIGSPVTLEDLKGESIVAFTQGGTPGITLRAVLNQNGIEYVEEANFLGHVGDDKVHIFYRASANLVVSDLLFQSIDGKEIRYALLAEPVVTAIAGPTQGNLYGPFLPAINISEEWAKNNGGTLYPQAGIIFKASLLENDKEFVNKFLDAARASADWALANPYEAGELAKNALNSAAIPGGAPVKAAVEAGRLPLNFYYPIEAKASVTAYLQAIIDDGSPTLVGGKLPDNGFYYRFT